MRLLKRFAGLLATFLLVLPEFAFAHAFGQQYSLPLPVELYIRGGVLAFVASCIIILLIRPKKNESKKLLFRIPDKYWRFLVYLIRLLSLGIFSLGLLSGLFGPDISYQNLLTIIFWIGLVLVVLYISMLVSGLWDIANPFRLITVFVLSRRKDRELKAWKYSYYPALVGYAALIISELFLSNIAVLPSNIFLGLLVYIGLGIFMSYRYGEDNWYKFGDVFSVFFHLASMLAPIDIRDKQITVSSPARKLVQMDEDNLSLTWFIIFALAATAYDGFRETAIFFNLSQGSNHLAFSIIVFAAFPLLFVSLYAASLWMSKFVSGSVGTLRVYMSEFTFSLIPIMMAYHFAHYFSLLITTLPGSFALISDPLGMGLNIFGTAGDRINLLIGADKIWYIELLVIVAGHIFGAYIGHKIAYEKFRSKRQILLSQLPILALMVAYTAFGLWILSEPFAI